MHENFEKSMIGGLNLFIGLQIKRYEDVTDVTLINQLKYARYT